MTATVRTATAADIEAIKQLALANRMFEPDEVGFFDDMILGFVNGDLPHDRWTLAERDAALLGAAYLAPEPFGDRVWNLFFLATEPSIHGKGIGTMLVDDIERHLTGLGAEAAQVLIVETSATDPYAGARRFYEHRNFDRESTIRDYYGPGDDKVTFWKAINR